MTESNEPLTFEQALDRLDAVVRELESGDTGLDQSLARYEEGVKLLKQCRAILDDAERKIRLLTGVDAEGNAITEEFETADTSERDDVAKRRTSSAGRGVADSAPATPDAVVDDEPTARRGRTTEKQSRRAADRELEGELPF